MDTSPPFCLQKIIESPLFLESSNVEGLGGGKGSCYTPKKLTCPLKRIQHFKRNISSFQPLTFKSYDRYTPTNYHSPLPKTLLKMIIPFPQGEMLVWRIPIRTPPSFSLPPWPPRLPACAVFGSRHELLSPKCSWFKTHTILATFFGANHLVKIGKSNKNWDTTLQK